MSTDYSGRMVDLLIFQGWKLPGAGDARISPGFGKGEVVAGIMKLLQMFAVRFLTEEGSSMQDPEFGTGFMSDIQRGVVGTEARFRALFSEAAADARSQLLGACDRLEEAGITVPDDERISEVVLESYSLQPDGVEITVMVRSEAGETRKVLLPVSAVLK